MERIKSGIAGLDEIMGGGIPKKQLTLITGTSGAGKTILSAQFIYKGVVESGDNGVYLSFEEDPESMKENLKSFGWDFDNKSLKEKVTFIKYDPYRVEDALDVLESAIREIKAKRVVIDSVSALGLHVRDKTELRRMIFNLASTLRKLETTVVMTSEIVPGTKGLSRYGVEEFVADGVIVLYYERISSVFSRAIQVWKMRGSAHSERLHPYIISSHGITVNANEDAFLRED